MYGPMAALGGGGLLVVSEVPLNTQSPTHTVEYDPFFLKYDLTHAIV